MLLELCHTESKGHKNKIMKFCVSFSLNFQFKIQLKTCRLKHKKSQLLNIKFKVKKNIPVPILPKNNC